MHRLKKTLSLRNAKFSGSFCKLTLGWSPSTSKEITLERKLIPMLKSLIIGIDDVGLSIKHPEIAISERVAFIKLLETNNLLQKTNFIGRYSRHLMLYDLIFHAATHVQKQISRSTITMIGVGGIGCWTSLNLACLGVGEIRLVDSDHVEESNLTRQILYNESDIGKLKVDIAKDRIKSFNSDINIKKYMENINSTDRAEELIEGSDVVVLSADYPPGLIQGWVSEACQRLNIPCINAGYLDITGTISRLSDPQLFFSPVNEKNDEITEIKKAFIQNYQAPSFGPINSLVSSMAALEVFKIITNYGSEYKQIYIDPFSLEVNIDTQ